MECRATRRLLPGYAEGDLRPAERVRCEAHLAACAACRGVLEDLRRLPAALAVWQPPAVDLVQRVVDEQSPVGPAAQPRVEVEVDDLPTPPEPLVELRPEHFTRPRWPVAAVEQPAREVVLPGRDRFFERGQAIAGDSQEGLERERLPPRRGFPRIQQAVEPGIQFRASLEELARA